MIGGRVLDTSALEHIATGRSVYARALVWAAVEHSNVLVVPTTALTLTWARIPAEAHAILEVLLGLPNTVLEVLDPPTAHQVGLFLAAAGSRGKLAEPPPRHQQMISRAR